MANLFYRNAIIENDRFYKVPKFIEVDFSDIASKDFILQEGDRLDIIAEQIYGNSNYWKAIALFNKVGYFFDLKPGDVVRLPLNINEVLNRI